VTDKVDLARYASVSFDEFVENNRRHKENGLRRSGNLELLEKFHENPEKNIHHPSAG